jgi:hypothetical protein
MYLLDRDSNVISFKRCEPFEGKNGFRNPDLWVEFSDGRSEIWEIKPEMMLLEPDVQEQIMESMEFARSIGVQFKVWVEKDSGLESDYNIMKWAREYLVGIGNQDNAKHYKETRKRIRQRHYKKVQADKVQVECEFCGETHEVLRLTYDRNVKKNGRFICIRKNGQLIGKRPKNHLKKTNLYARDGKKQCSTCHEVKLIEVFSVHRSTFDGRNPRCKDCWKKKRLDASVAGSKS